MGKSFLLFFKILICISPFIHALEPEKLEYADENSKAIINKYVNNISDIEDTYVINQKLSKAISRYFKNKLVMLPLYKINLKIDRNPIKIPWTLGKPETENSIESRQYRIEKPKLNTT